MKHFINLIKGHSFWSRLAFWRYEGRGRILFEFLQGAEGLTFALGPVSYAELYM